LAALGGAILQPLGCGDLGLFQWWVFPHETRRFLMGKMDDLMGQIWIFSASFSENF